MPKMPSDKVHLIQQIFNAAFNPTCPVCKHPFKNTCAKLNWVMPVSNGWLAIIEDTEIDQSYTVMIKPINSQKKVGLMYSDFEKELPE